MALSAGDIAIIGVNTDGDDSFSFVALANIAPGETIFFTDNAYVSDLDGMGNPGLRGTEGTLQYTVPAAGLAAGQVVSFTGPAGTGDLPLATDPPTAGFSRAIFDPSGFSLTVAGDQILVFQGDVDFGGASISNTRYIYALQTNSTEFQSSLTNTTPNIANLSELPPGLTVGQTAVAVGVGAGDLDETDNAVYDTSSAITSGTRGQLLSALSTVSNWTQDNDPLTLPPGPLTAVLPDLAIAGTTATANEGNTGGPTNLTFTVTRTGADTSSTARVAYAVTGSGANAATADDFVGSVLPSGTVEFPANSTSQTITIPVQVDTAIEPDEGFTVTLSNAFGNAQLGATTAATGTITNDDFPPPP